MAKDLTQQQFHVIDNEGDPYFRISHAFVEHVGWILGVYGSCVYISLKHHANYKTGKCYPSMKKIASEWNMSLPMVNRAIRQLEELNIIEAKSGKLEGRPNYYILKALREWKLPFEIEEGVLTTDIPLATTFIPGINHIATNKKNKQEEETIKYIVEFLNSTLKTSYRYQSKTTQKHITARLNEGFTLEDFKTVIKYKAKEWQGTDNHRYLRPETLFGTKFESYLEISKMDISIRPSSTDYPKSKRKVFTSDRSLASYLIQNQNGLQEKINNNEVEIYLNERKVGQVSDWISKIPDDLKFELEKSIKSLGA